MVTLAIDTRDNDVDTGAIDKQCEKKIPTMSAKSLGTLPVFYAVDELQNPLPRTTMLF